MLFYNLYLINKNCENTQRNYSNFTNDFSNFTNVFSKPNADRIFFKKCKKKKMKNTPHLTMKRYVRL